MKKLLITLFIILCCSAKTFAGNINVAFTIDNNYPIFALIVIDSILSHNYSNSDYTFYIVEDNVSKYNKRKMRRFVEHDKHQKIEFIHVDTYAIDHGKNLFTFSNRITPIAFARILLPDLLPKTVRKVIYIDADTLVTTDLKELYDIELGRYPVGMALSSSQNNGALALHKFRHGYYNSGVLLMNLDRWRAENITKKMINFVRKNESKFVYDENRYGYFWMFPDQDVINVVLDGRIKRLDQRWNNQCLKGQAMLDYYVYGIYHYIGVYKPWDFIQYYDPYVQIYLDFWERSPLVLYKYYYVIAKTQKEFNKIKNKKIRRYKSFMQKIRYADKNVRINDLFYMPEEISR